MQSSETSEVRVYPKSLVDNTVKSTRDAYLGGLNCLTTK